MIEYQLEITHSAEKALLKYPKKLQDRIINKIKKLAENPRPLGFKRLFGFNGYRIRIGDYRVVYSVADDKRLVKVIDIGHRKDIYRNI